MNLKTNTKRQMILFVVAALVMAFIFSWALPKAEKIKEVADNGVIPTAVEMIKDEAKEKFKDQKEKLKERLDKYKESKQAKANNSHDSTPENAPSNQTAEGLDNPGPITTRPPVGLNEEKFVQEMAVWSDPKNFGY